MRQRPNFSDVNGEEIRQQADVPQLLQAAGVNPTAQRIAIGRFVLCGAEHPTAEDVKSWADANFPKMSLATVYNTLNKLVKAGLLTELKLPHTEKSIYDSNLVKHYHFFDETTGVLSDIPTSEIDLSGALFKKIKVKDIEIVVRGSKRRLTTNKK